MFGVVPKVLYSIQLVMIIIYVKVMRSLLIEDGINYLIDNGIETSKTINLHYYLWRYKFEIFISNMVFRR